MFPLLGTDIDDLLSNQIPSLPGIRSIETRLILDSRRVGQSWRFQRLTPDQNDALAGHVVPVNLPALGSIDELSDLEFGTMCELGRNARASAAEVARTLNVSSSSAYRAIQMLLGTGAISPRVEVEPCAVGFPLTAVVSLQVKPKTISDVLDQLSGHESARMITMVTGQAPVVFHGVFRNPRSLADFITEDIGAPPRHSVHGHPGGHQRHAALLDGPGRTVHRRSGRRTSETIAEKSTLTGRRGDRSPR